MIGKRARSIIRCASWWRSECFRSPAVTRTPTNVAEIWDETGRTDSLRGRLSAQDFVGFGNQTEKPCTGTREEAAMTGSTFSAEREKGRPDLHLTPFCGSMASDKSCLA